MRTQEFAQGKASKRNDFEPKINENSEQNLLAIFFALCYVKLCIFNQLQGFWWAAEKGGKGLGFCEPYANLSGCGSNPRQSGMTWDAVG
jgi:hypothetical protein